MKCIRCNKNVDGDYQLCESCRRNELRIQEKPTNIQAKVEKIELSSINDNFNETNDNNIEIAKNSHQEELEIIKEENLNKKNSFKKSVL